MTIVRLGNELVNIKSIERFKSYAEDKLWCWVDNSTPIVAVEAAEHVLCKDGMLYVKTTDKWLDFWERGFYPDSQAFKQKQSLRDFTENILSKKDTKEKDKEIMVVPFKYNEAELLKEFNTYVANTYKQHYVGENNVQSLDLIFALGMGKDFCKGNGIKYLARAGKKDGQERNDLLKTLHYTLLALYLFDKAAAKED